MAADRAALSSRWTNAPDHILNARIEPTASGPSSAFKVNVQVFDGETIEPHEIEVHGMRYTAQNLRDASKAAAENKAMQQVRDRVRVFQDKLKQASQEGENFAVVAVPSSEFNANIGLYDQIKWDLHRCGFVWRTSEHMKQASNFVITTETHIKVSFQDTRPCHETYLGIRAALEHIGCKSSPIPSLPETIDFQGVPFSIDLEPDTRIIRLVPVGDLHSDSAKGAMDELYMSIEVSHKFMMYNLDRHSTPFHRIELRPVSI